MLRNERKHCDTLVRGDRKCTVLGSEEQDKRQERNSIWTFRYHQSSLSVKTQEFQFETNHQLTLFLEESNSDQIQTFTGKGAFVNYSTQLPLYKELRTRLPASLHLNCPIPHLTNCNCDHNTNIIVENATDNTQERELGKSQKATHTYNSKLPSGSYQFHYWTHIKP